MHRPTVVRRSSFASLALGTCLLAAACRGDARAPADERAAARAEDDAPPPLPPAEPSRVDVPLDYDFTPVLRVVERVVPRTFGSLDSVRTVGDDERRRFAFEATRGAFTAFVEDSLLHLRTRIAYAARGWYKPRVGPTLGAGCGNDDARPTLVVELVTPIAVDSAWRLRSRARVGRVAPATEGDGDRCKVSVIRYDVTDRVVEAARRALDSRTTHIDRTVAGISLAPRAAQWWAMLGRPIRLADGVWLELRPQRLRLGGVGGTGRVLTVRAGLDALPRIVVADRPPPAWTEPLPPLAHDTAAGGFRVLVDGVVDYATASREITEALRGRTIARAGREAKLRSVAVSRAPRGALALTVSFDGDATGTLRLVGTPRLDAARAAVVVPDLDYDLATDDGLVNAVAWAKGEQLRELLRDRARVPVAPVLARGRALLERGLNRTVGRTLALSAAVDSVAVDGLFVTAEGLLVRARAAGTARVAVRSAK